MFGLGLVGLWVLASRVRAHASVRLGIGALFGLYLWCVTPLGANLMVAAVEFNVRDMRRCTKTESRPVVVVLAGGMTGSPARADDVSRLQEAGYRRTIEGTRLAATMPASLLVFSGGSASAVAEADMMRELALNLGFPADRIVTERGSRTTYESAVEVARWLRSMNMDQVHLVTSALHMTRAVGVFRAQALGVCPYAVDPQWIRPDPQDALIPQVSALNKSTAALHEIVGWLWYRSTGKLTRHQQGK